MDRTMIIISAVLITALVLVVFLVIPQIFPGEEKIEVKSESDVSEVASDVTESLDEVSSALENLEENLG